MLRSIAVATVAVSSVAAFQAPSSFVGNGLQLKATCSTSGMQMSAADEASTSRRAALGAILGSAIAIPGTAFAYLEGGAKNNDRNFQLKNGGVMTDVVSSSMSGTRASGFGQAIIGNAEKAKSLARPPISDEDIVTIDRLTERASAKLSAKKYRTSNKIGINPAYGGSSGIFTGAE